MTTVCFYPHIGGIETVTKYLANEFEKKGHSVCVLTNTTINGEEDKFPYRVVRNPSVKEVWEEYKQCDVFVHQQISLKYIWPLLLKKKPWVVVHHGVDLPKGFLGFIKRLFFNKSNNIAVSQATADGYRLNNYIVIHNSYDKDNFYIENNKTERKGIVFVGKCSEAKGVKLLINAFDNFKQETLSDTTLTIVGDGEERMNLQGYVKSLKSSSDITFVGFKNPSEIRSLLNKCEYQVVPSIANEAFGVVVLEGLACGCIVIGSSGDGIEEAIGDSGIIFQKGDVASLQNALNYVYSMTPVEKNVLFVRTKEHLEKYQLSIVADKYISFFESLLNK